MKITTEIKEYVKIKLRDFEMEKSELEVKKLNKKYSKKFKELIILKQKFKEIETKRNKLENLFLDMVRKLGYKVSWDYDFCKFKRYHSANFNNEDYIKCIISLEGFEDIKDIDKAIKLALKK